MRRTDGRGRARAPRQLQDTVFVNFSHINHFSCSPMNLPRTTLSLAAAAPPPFRPTRPSTLTPPSRPRTFRRRLRRCPPIQPNRLRRQRTQLIRRRDERASRRNGASGNVREETWHGRGMVAFPVHHWHVVRGHCVGTYPLLFSPSYFTHKCSTPFKWTLYLNFGCILPESRPRSRINARPK